MSEGWRDDDDAETCEYVGCSNKGWVVLHFGPNLTPPVRVACQTHQKVDDLTMFPLPGDADE